MALSLSFNDVFQYIGDTGFYQVLLYCSICLLAFYTSIHNIAYNFFAAPMDHWCKVTRLENFSFETQKYVAVPNIEDDPTEYQSCKMFDLDYDNLTDDQILNWDRNITANTSLIDCTEWIYDRSVFISTINSKYDLVCDRGWLSEMATTLYMAGVLLGSLVSGIISDRFGRKIPLLLFLVGFFAFALSQAYAPNYPIFVTVRFTNGLCNMAAYLCAYVIITEIFGRTHYVLLATTFHIFFSVGYMLLAGIAYSIRDHEKLFIATSSFVLATLPFVWLVPESPRWLIAQGEYKKAEKILHNIAAVNRADFPEEVTWIIKSEQQKKGKWGDLSKSRILCLQLALMYFNWFSVSLVYYGVSYNAGAFGDVFLNVFLSGLIEIPANLLCYLSLSKVGRRWSNAGSLLITAAVELSLVPILLVRPDMTQLLTALSTIGKGAVTFAFSTIYLFTAELFPTPVRHLAVGSSSMFARVGSMAAPFLGSTLEEIWLPMPSLIFGIMAAITGSLVLLLPETKGHKVPDTVQEAEYIAKAKKKNKSLSSVDLSDVGHESEIATKGGFQNKAFDETMNFEKINDLSKPKVKDISEDGTVTRL